MPELIKGMYHVEYLAIFYSIIIGVIATEFFSGWSMIIRYRAISKPYPLHLVWSIFGFITLLQNWYGIWPRIEFINKNFLYFLAASALNDNNLMTNNNTPQKSDGDIRGAQAVC